ncbi:MAG TPA: fluoride efflux transporter CrcB [Bacillaceae bacterium]
MNVLAIGIGGMLGSLLRFFAGKATAGWWLLGFPAGTFFVNMLGSFMLGYLTARWKKSSSIPSYLQKGIGTGLIGSFTTFSAFSVETAELIQSGRFGSASLYVLISLAGGIILALAGYKIGAGFSKRRVANS